MPTLTIEYRTDGERLALEQAIASVTHWQQVEGSIQQLLNKRIQQTGPRWKTAHVGPFVKLGALAAGSEWHAFWSGN
jgi:hypothetical protein